METTAHLPLTLDETGNIVWPEPEKRLYKTNSGFEMWMTDKEYEQWLEGV